MELRAVIKRLLPCLGSLDADEGRSEWHSVKGTNMLTIDCFWADYLVCLRLKSFY